MCLTFIPVRGEGLCRVEALGSKLFSGGNVGDYVGEEYRVFKGDTRSLDYGSYDSDTPYFPEEPSTCSPRIGLLLHLVFGTSMSLYEREPRCYPVGSWSPTR